MSEVGMVVDWSEGFQVVRPALPGELPEPPPIGAGDVNLERDRRLQFDFSFMDKMIQRDDISLRRIQGAAQLATIALLTGVSADSEEWINGGPLVWITSDNTELHLTPMQTIRMGQEAAAIESRLVFAAKTLKQMNPIPTDYSDDAWWE